MTIINNIFLLSDKYIFLAPSHIWRQNEETMFRDKMKNEHRRLELFLYIDHWAGVTPLLGVKSQLAFH